MATPNLTAGVTETVKPRRLSSPVSWRFEGSLAAGATVTTPIFDYIPDGRPYTEVEAAAGAIVRVPSRFCVLTHHHPSAIPGARVQVFHLTDTGVQLSPVTLYAPGGGGSGATGRFNRWLYELCGRRCQFRLVNTPLGVNAGDVGTQILELTWEGP